MPTDRKELFPPDHHTTTMRLAIFDLDYTVWQPEMYQLYGPPQLVSVESSKASSLSASILKEAQTIHGDKILMDRSRPMRVFPGAYVNSNLKHLNA